MAIQERTKEVTVIFWGEAGVFEGGASRLPPIIGNNLRTYVRMWFAKVDVIRVKILVSLHSPMAYFPPKLDETYHRGIIIGLLGSTG